MENRGQVQPAGGAPNSLPLGAQENFGAVQTQATPNQAPVGHVGGLTEPQGGTGWGYANPAPGGSNWGSPDPAGAGHLPNIQAPAGGVFGLKPAGGGWTNMQADPAGTGYGDVNIAATNVDPTQGPNGS